MSDAKKQERNEGKRARVPFGARRSNLQLSNEEQAALEEAGYVIRWFNDADGRVERALGGGWDFVLPEEATSVGTYQITKGNTDIGSKVSKVVSRGEPIIRAYLMKIKKEYYEEDQRVKEENNLLVDQALAGGGAGGASVENAYLPDGGDSAVKYQR
jgi:hypothetical protein